MGAVLEIRVNGFVSLSLLVVVNCERKETQRRQHFKTSIEMARKNIYSCNMTTPVKSIFVLFCISGRNPSVYICLSYTF